MGQYWTPLMTKGSLDLMEYLCTHYWNNGYKFMEHSWIGNEIPSVVMYRLYKNPMLLAWVGDECDDSIWEGGPSGRDLWNNDWREKMFSLINYKEIPSYIKKNGRFCPEEYEHFKEISDEEVSKFMRMFNASNIVNYVIANHTKKQYLSMKEYMSKVNASFGSDIMHPLPVLTACSSLGDGLGDYHKRYSTNWPRVGKWMWNVLSVEDEPPKGFRKVSTEKYTFEEKRND